jgi:predicted protein tyrosine phosphatase
MRVRVLSKNMFDTLLPRMRIDESNVDTQNAAFISIVNSDSIGTSYFKNEHSNVLKLVFDDTTSQENHRRIKQGQSELTVFSREQAQQILDFVNKHKDVETFYVHCLAGRSRSGAVGTFINDIYGSQTFEQFLQSNTTVSPNYYILALLRRVYNNIEDDDTDL